MNTATYCPRCECPSCVAVRVKQARETNKPRVPAIGTRPKEPR